MTGGLRTGSRRDSVPNSGDEYHLPRVRLSSPIRPGNLVNYNEWLQSKSKVESQDQKSYFTPDRFLPKSAHFDVVTSHGLRKPNSCHKPLRAAKSLDAVYNLKVDFSSGRFLIPLNDSFEDFKRPRSASGSLSRREKLTEQKNDSLKKLTRATSVIFTLPNRFSFSSLFKGDFSLSSRINKTNKPCVTEIFSENKNLPKVYRVLGELPSVVHAKDVSGPERGPSSRGSPDGAAFPGEFREENDRLSSDFDDDHQSDCEGLKIKYNSSVYLDRWEELATLQNVNKGKEAYQVVIKRPRLTPPTVFDPLLFIPPTRRANREYEKRKTSNDSSLTSQDRSSTCTSGIGNDWGTGSRGNISFQDWDEEGEYMDINIESDDSFYEISDSASDFEDVSENTETTVAMAVERATPNEGKFGAACFIFETLERESNKNNKRRQKLSWRRVDPEVVTNTNLNVNHGSKPGWRRPTKFSPMILDNNSAPSSPCLYGSERRSAQLSQLLLQNQSCKFSRFALDYKLWSKICSKVSLAVFLWFFGYS
ncbi:hypothetical protein QYM36_004390 [Artemia franciscana]|uniref:Uncharacterized protein n=1 Tax=Artemia franciscana TaxID=6661 RepID=A0AA88I075_ARTSF|nr:hypothetical protein QYM36_004390 [Artemia franciscana]